jgi:hypothetical protein
MERTLVELILLNFGELKSKKLLGTKSTRRSKTNTAKISKSTISRIIQNILAVSPREQENEEGAEEEHEEPFVIEIQERDAAHGGYGTVKNYSGTSQSVSYVNYDKIWGHLGLFRSYGMFENSQKGELISMSNGESSREMVSERIMDMGARNFKYFGNMNINNTSQDMMTITSLVPPPGSGINSKDWEKYTLMMKMSIYQPIIALKFKFA